MKKLILLFVLFLSTQMLKAQQADMVLTGGNIITLKNKGARAEALAIKDGKILAVGTNAEVLKFKGKTTRVVPLKGQTVIPGFNDVHQHPAPVYEFKELYAVLKLDTVSSMKNLDQPVLKRKAAITPKGMLNRGVGYNETKLGGQPIRDSLDKAIHPASYIRSAM
jgi:predicted amidohydrolase YtcJ